MTHLTPDDLTTIRQRWERATPGPWLWTGHTGSKSFELMSPQTAWGDVVMTCRRWGMQGAMPVFNVDGLLSPATKHMVIPQRHNAWMVRGIDHPDAIAIESAPSDVAALLAHIAALEAERQVAS